VHGVPGTSHLRARGRRSGAGAARRDRGARGRARAVGRGRCRTHGPDDRMSQRLRAALHRRSRFCRSLAAQVRRIRGWQHARHEAGYAVRGSRPARPARRHRPAAVRALPRRAARWRAVRRLLPSCGPRSAARFRPGRPVTFYPVFLNLRGRRAVVIGGGAVAEQKVLGLLAAGAHVTVVSPETTRRLADLAAAGGIELRRRPYRSGDLAGAWLAIAGTDDRGANARVWAEAEREGRAASSLADEETGVVYLVGAGPGDPGLITARGLEILRSADVLVYDRLVAPALVAEAPPSAERVFVGKRPHGRGTDLAQEEINALLVDRARRGLTVVRLKGGDPFVFGRGAEECEALHAAGVPCRVVPGVTSAIAAPAAAGIPVTHPRL